MNEEELKKDQLPTFHTLWLHVRELVQLERITFRADLLSEEICSL